MDETVFGTDIDTKGNDFEDYCLKNELRVSEAETILKQSLIKTDGKVRNDSHFLADQRPVFSKAHYTIGSFGIRRNEKIAVQCTVRDAKAEEILKREVNTTKLT